MSTRTSCLMLAALLLPARLHSQGWVEPPPSRPWPPSGGVVRVSSSVRITVEGNVARFEVEERFRNDGGRVAEGSYLYPLPGEAVFNNFSLFQGDQELRGEIMNADKARGIYEEIVRRLRDPALLTLAGHGLVRAQVFPIQPGETRKVILRYTSVLAREGAAYRIRYPLGARSGGPVAVTVTAPDAERWGIPFSPTHELDWRTTREQLQVTVRTDPAGQLDLLLPPAGGIAGTALMAHATSADDRFFMLVVSPPARPATRAMPRDLTLVVDVSGSMSGEKMEQARAALHQALGSLRREDRFEVVAFASRVMSFREGLTAATPDALRNAREFVDGLQANGGTNIQGALNAVLGDRVPEDRMGIVLFLTDGLPSVGEQRPEQIAASAAAQLRGRRVFPIGVGHDVNTWLLDRLAVEGKGRVEYVAPTASVETAVGGVLARLDAPALTDLRIVRAPVRLVDLAPAELPDLFNGEELVLMGRYLGTGSGPIVIEGRRGGRTERITARAVFPRHESDHEYIAPLWAARRVGELTRELRLSGHKHELIQEIRELGQRYGILTEYTSYLVLEPGAVMADARPRAEEPSRQTGQEAFREAERSSQLMQAKAANDLAAAPGPVAGGRGNVESRRAGTRLFVDRDGVWTDVGHTDSVKVIAVAPFSPAWFALSRALPELADASRLGEQVVIAGRRTSIRVAPDGVARLTSQEVDRIVSEFRGT